MYNEKINVTFLLSHIPNPRMYKRIEALSKNYNVSIICLRRLNQDIFSLRNDLNVPHFVCEMTVPSFRNYWGRIKSSNKYAKFALNALKNIKPALIYTAGLDSLTIANKYGKAKIIYEVADLRESFIETVEKQFKDKVIDKMIAWKERKSFKKVALLVVTSMKFYDMHYSKFYSRDRVLELPNMPTVAPFKEYKPKNHAANFSVGFIGGFRYPEQMKNLVKAAEKVNVKVIFAGGTSDVMLMDVVNELSKSKNVEFLGKYDYAKDIARLYGKVDVVYSVYDADNPNVRIALPNKLYESVYCALPILVAENTYLSELVKEWGVGISIPHKDVGALSDALMTLRDNKELYSSILERCNELKEEMRVEKYMDNLCRSVNKCLMGGG